MIIPFRDAICLSGSPTRKEYRLEDFEIDDIEVCIDEFTMRVKSHRIGYPIMYNRNNSVFFVTRDTVMELVGKIFYDTGREHSVGIIKKVTDQFNNISFDPVRNGYLMFKGHTEEMNSLFYEYVMDEFSVDGQRSRIIYDGNGYHLFFYLIRMIDGRYYYPLYRGYHIDSDGLRYNNTDTEIGTLLVYDDVDRWILSDIGPEEYNQADPVLGYDNTLHKILGMDRYVGYARVIRLAVSYKDMLRFSQLKRSHLELYRNFVSIVTSNTPRKIDTNKYRVLYINKFRENLAIDDSFRIHFSKDLNVWEDVGSIRYSDTRISEEYASMDIMNNIPINDTLGIIDYDSEKKLYTYYTRANIKLGTRGIMYTESQDLVNWGRFRLLEITDPGRFDETSFYFPCIIRDPDTNRRIGILNHIDHATNTTSLLIAYPDENNRFRIQSSIHTAELECDFHRSKNNIMVIPGSFHTTKNEQRFIIWNHTILPVEEKRMKLVRVKKDRFSSIGFEKEGLISLGVRSTNKDPILNYKTRDQGWIRVLLLDGTRVVGESEPMTGDYIEGKPIWIFRDEASYDSIRVEFCDAELFLISNLEREEKRDFNLISFYYFEVNGYMVKHKVRSYNNTGRWITIKPELDEGEWIQEVIGDPIYSEGMTVAEVIIQTNKQEKRIKLYENRKKEHNRYNKRYINLCASGTRFVILGLELKNEAVCHLEQV